MKININGETREMTAEELAKHEEISAIIKAALSKDSVENDHKENI